MSLVALRTSIPLFEAVPMVQSTLLGPSVLPANDVVRRQDGRPQQCALYHRNRLEERNRSPQCHQAHRCGSRSELLQSLSNGCIVREEKLRRRWICNPAFPLRSFPFPGEKTWGWEIQYRIRPNCPPALFAVPTSTPQGPVLWYHSVWILT